MELADVGLLEDPASLSWLTRTGPVEPGVSDVPSRSLVARSLPRGQTIARRAGTYDDRMTQPPFDSFAQNGEDVVLWRALGHIANGRYVDVGANHPTNDSVTRAFYDRGWRGIAIEPDPTYARLVPPRASGRRDRGGGRDVTLGRVRHAAPNTRYRPFDPGRRHRRRPPQRRV